MVLRENETIEVETAELKPWSEFKSELESAGKKNKRSLFNKALQEIAKTLLMCLTVAVSSVCVLALALYYVSPIVENVLTFGLVGELDYLVAGSAIVVMMYAVSSVWKMMDWWVK